MINGQVTEIKYKLLKLINSLSYPNSPNDHINCSLIPNDWDKEVTCILGRAE